MGASLTAPFESAAHAQGGMACVPACAIRGYDYTSAASSSLESRGPILKWLRSLYLPGRVRVEIGQPPREPDGRMSPSLNLSGSMDSSLASWQAVRCAAARQLGRSGHRYWASESQMASQPAGIRRTACSVLSVQPRMITQRRHPSTARSYPAGG